MKQPTEQDYAVAMEMLYADGEWYRFPRWVLKIRPQGKRIKPGEAHTLAAALSQSSFQKAVALSQGWFDFDHDQAEEDTGYGERQQRYHLAELVEYGIVERKRESAVHGKRQLRINYPLLVELIGKVNRSTPAKMTGINRQRLPESILIEDKNVNTDSRPAERTTDGDGFQLGENGLDRSESFQLAKNLQAILIRHDRIYRKVNLKQWTGEFTVLLRKVSASRIRSALAGYDRLFNDEFMVQACSAATFCKEFGRIEAAIARIDRKAQPKKAKQDLGW